MFDKPDIVVQYKRQWLDPSSDFWSIWHQLGSFSDITSATEELKKQMDMKELKLNMDVWEGCYLETIYNFRLFSLKENKPISPSPWKIGLKVEN